MKVTIGISFFNNEGTLGAAIQSVFAQSMQDWELILVDDGSTDRSLDIARGIRDPRVRVVSDGRNLGFAARLNQISRMATGEYIARMDADDLMHPDRLETQVGFLSANPDVDLVGSACYVINRSGDLLGLGHTGPLDARPAALLRKCPFPHPSCMGRRNWFERNAYNEAIRRADDTELWMRTAQVSVITKLDAPLLYYRITGHSTAWDYLQKNFLGLCEHLALVRDHGPPIVGRLQSFLIMSRILAFHISLVPFALVGRQATLIHRHSPPMDPAEREAAARTLAWLHQVEVPGLTDRAVRLRAS